MEFEWDDVKRLENLKKHGVDFTEARTCFYDPHAIELFDEAHSQEEERFILLGSSEKERLLVTVFAERQRLRIISSRKATPKERQAYAGRI